MSEISLESVFGDNSKRRKTGDDVSEYATGSIIRITLRNFMAYSKTEINPGPYLNMIIGPNGTGKSTFVCAICIGLAGKLRYLGKETMTLDQFIKQGEDSGYIETEIAYRGSSVVIRRDLTRNTRSHAGQWRINGRDATEKKVIEILQEVNIQLDNLCQFLPQDRVAKFAALKPEELLTEVERSYGKGELLQQHEEAASLYDEKVQVEKQIASMKIEKEQLEEAAKSLQDDVSRLEQYKQKKRQMELYGHLLPFVELDEMKKRVKDLKQVFREAKAALEQLEQDTMPFNNRKSEAATVVNSLEDKIQALERKLEKKRRESSTASAYFREVEDEISKLQSQIGSLDETVKRQRAQLLTTRKDIEGFQAQIDELNARVLGPEEVDALKQHRQEIQHQLSAAIETRDEDRVQRDDIRDSIRNIDRRIASKQSGLDVPDRLQMLDFHTHGKLIKAVRALRSAQDQLGIRGKYMEPPCVSLNVRPEYSAQFEKSVSYANQNAITVVDSETYGKVSRFLFDQVKVNVSIRTLSSNWRAPQRPSKAEVQSYGFDAYLSDVVSGPREVIQMLCENDNIDQIPIGLQELSEAQKTAITFGSNGRVPFMRFITGRELHRVTRSNYGRKQAATTVTLIQENASVFTGPKNSDAHVRRIKEEIAALESEKQLLQSSLEEAEERYKQSKRAAGELQNMRDQDQDRLRANSDTLARINNCKERLSGKESEFRRLKKSIEKAQNTAGEALRLREKINKMVVQKLKRVEKMIGICKEMQDLKETLARLHIQKTYHETVITTLSDLIKEMRQEKQSAIDRMNKAEEDLSKAAEESKAKTRELREKSAEMSPNEQQELHQLAQSLKDQEQYYKSHLIMQIRQMKMELDLVSPDRASIGRLQENTKRLQEIGARLPDLEQTYTNTETSVLRVTASWVPELQNLVGKISDRFAASFATVASAGEVRLVKEEDFRKWRLEILVKFRDEAELTVLDSHVQSGGEKSVSTAIFINSLQGLTSSPFRVVDEINQGMDAKNERLIHELIVKTSCEQNGKSQYFLITPKLLNDLYYHSSMSVHCVMSGPKVPSSEEDTGYLSFGILKSYV